MAEWILVRKGGDYVETGRKYGISPVIARLLKNRGVEGDAIPVFLSEQGAALSLPDSLPDMEKAYRVIKDRIDKKEKIRVIGDYDIDGVCATAILLKGLKTLGADADHTIPHRINDGYGMNPGMVEDAAGAGVSLIVTCDNGIAATEECALASELGIDVVVTDHHEVRYEEEGGVRKYILPKAAAVVDPKREDNVYPCPGICGAVVAYQLIRYIMKREDPSFEGSATDREMMQLAAFATVGDIMELGGENRGLVKRGLKSISEEPCRGMAALKKAAGLEDGEVSAFHLGFVLGPMVNAGGRLDSADRALELFMSEDDISALKRAEELKALNESRKSMTEKAVADAGDIMKKEGLENDTVLVVYLPECHESIAGIVAGRLREKYIKPVLVVTNGRDELKGSARSVPAYHMFDAMLEIKDVFIKFGGHSQAAGFSLPKDRLGELRRRLNENCRLKASDMKEVLKIDMELPLCYSDDALADALEALEPYGEGNERALFGRMGVEITGIKNIGVSGKVIKIDVKDSGSDAELTMFGKNRVFKEELAARYGEDKLQQLYMGRGAGIRFNIVYSVAWNLYNGIKRLQIVVEDYKWAD
ncbi:MAG: single-stranded-DNA-specific exonuclease RecJ [Lachnospiraceae bacterium]|nr:single-stranded-DNA-specific exonuclease RecJ [Lachnospiraceae bacterium]